MRADLPAVPAVQRGNVQRVPPLPKANTAQVLRKQPSSLVDESGEHATVHSSMPVPKGTVSHGPSVKPPPLGRPLLAPSESEWEAELARHKRRVEEEESEWRLLREQAREEEEREWRALRARVEEDEWKALRESAREREEREWSQLIAEAKQRATLTLSEVNEERAWEQRIARAKSEAAPAIPAAPVRPAARAQLAARGPAHPLDSIAPARAARPNPPRVVCWP